MKTGWNDLRIESAFPVGHALASSLRTGYGLSEFRHDAVAGLIVSLVALPLAMALSIAVGLPPQHGLYTAIVAGAVVPLLGGSTYQVSGPTAAFVVIVAPIVAGHGLRGLIITTVMAGILLIALGLARLGRYINYVPYPVTTGFTSGIAVVIATLALNDFLGLGIASMEGGYVDKLLLIAQALPSLHWPEALVGFVTLAVMFTAGRILPNVPPPVTGIVMGTFLAIFLNSQEFSISTIGSRFSYGLPDGASGQGIPPFAPEFHLPGFDASALFAMPGMAELQVMFIPALIVALLAALESLLSAAVADGMAGGRHQPNAELIGIGIGNILTGLAAGIPATGAIARTATNIQSGARTPIAASIHAVLILLYVVVLAPAMSYLPMASLAALLMMVAYRMSQWRQFLRVIQIAPGSDTVVLLACFAFTVLVDMVAGVTVGVVLACFLLVKQIASLTQTGISHASTGIVQKLREFVLSEGVMVLHVTGPLFFGTVEKIIGRAAFMQEGIRTFVIDMEDVPLIDMSGLVAIRDLILDSETGKRQIVLVGRPETTKKILQKLPAATREKLLVTSSLTDALAQPEMPAKRS